MAIKKCPKCGSDNISYQREQTASVGASTNKVVIQKPHKKRGCLYWLLCGWLFELCYWMMFGFWKNLFLGKRKKSGINFHANKSINHTMGVCQNCGHAWKV